MSEIMQTINALLERYMSRKSGDILKCVIVSSFLLACASIAFVPTCISTLECQIIYGVIIAVIVLATIGFLIKILKSEDKDEPASSDQDNQPVASPASEDANGRLLNHDENTSSSRRNGTELQEVVTQSSTSNPTRRTTGIQINATGRAKIKVNDVDVEEGRETDVQGVIFQGTDDVTFASEGTVRVHTRNENN